MESCKICGHNSWGTRYSGAIRAGGLGTVADISVNVFRCEHCEVEWLPNFSANPEYYQQADYRNEIGESCDIKHYEKLHDQDVRFQFENVPLQSCRDKVVVDVGCGGGLFLDAIKGFAAKTIGIEPNDCLRLQVCGKGHLVYPNLEEAVAEAARSADLVVCFNVIEHVQHPVHFVRKMAQLLREGGKLLVTTPNSADFLVTNGPEEFKRHFYRKVHEWYFNERSLSILLMEAGLFDIEMAFQHSYGLSNTLVWMRDKKGVGRNDILDDAACDFAWAQYLVRTKQAERIIGSAIIAKEGN